jgi:fermentation-respiration switch protein FrsA (DUF1100 family)
MLAVSLALQATLTFEDARNPPLDVQEAARREQAPLDPVRYLPRLQVPVLLQFATKDEHVPKARADLIVAATRDPKAVSWYDADHELNVADAKRDRLAWIRKVLKV